MRPDLKQEGEPRPDDEAECEWAPLHLCDEQHTNSVVVAKANLMG